MSRTLTALIVAAPLALGACGGDKDGGGTTDSGGGPGPVSALAAFDDNDWYGTCTRGSFEFPCEANLDYDEAAGQVTGTMDIDGVWEVVIVENDDGSISATGTPFFGDDVFTATDLAVADGIMTGNWMVDYGGSTAEGTLEMSDQGPMASN